MMHSRFFSSLNQVEKRLKLDSSLSETPQHSSELLSSPLFLHADHFHNHNLVSNQSSKLENSETPVEFLSNSIEFPQTHQNPPLKSPQNDPQIVNSVEKEVDEIGLLVELLGLSSPFEKDDSELEFNPCGSCHCEGGFYERIVGVKGPKCAKEMERLEGWIKHFRNDNIDPLRLAHLLLGKATCIRIDNEADCNGNGNGNGGGFEGIEFPSTVEEFLRRDPPTKFGVGD